jgi:predicted ATPase/DNA-binding winged helix-turn-helix (wHTH) protein
MGTDENLVRVRFGGFELQPGERRLLVDGQPAAVGPRAFDVLMVLVERGGKLVTKSELLDRVWPNLVVEENNLQVQVSALRKILGPDAIITVPGHGYRFTLDPTGEDAPAAVAATAPKHNLPQQLTSFIGRERELSELGALLQKTRLLTMVGFGGIGKTRLALRLADEIADAYPDGAWFVELAALTDARMVAHAVASALGVREDPRRPVLEAVVNHLKERRMLLLLDTCEHLVQACADLARQLLQSAPHIKIVATSRERLNLSGETAYTVSAMSMPGPTQAIALAALSQYEAVRLFVDRARAAHPAFLLTHQNAAAVAGICHRVDGIPLAIELASARVRVLSPEKIAERLSDRLRLLTRGDRTALPHRQTLRALIDWSHELLTGSERGLLHRLAVFPGGFTLEAAEAVGAGGDIAEADVLDLLTELIEKSMVVVEATGERYRLLDTVREYAQERLAASGEGDRARTHHLDFYLAFAERARLHFLGADQGTWFARLDPERENLLAAHAWSGHAEGGAESGLRLVYAVSLYWIHRGAVDLGYRTSLEAITRAPREVRSLARCRALHVAAQFASLMGHYAEAMIYGEEELSIAREIGDETRVVLALLSLAMQFYGEAKTREARKHVEEALPLARRLEQKAYVVSTLLQLGDIDRFEGELDAAARVYEESVALARECGDLRGLILSLIDLASVLVGQGSKDRPRELVLEAVALVEQVGSKPLGAFALVVAAGIAASAAEWRRAAQLYGTAMAQCAQMGLRIEPADEVFLAPLIAKAREATGSTAFATAEAAGRAVSYEGALAEARAWLMDLS